MLQIPTMRTLKVDSRKRVLLTGATPGQVFARMDNGDGSITLMPVKPDTKPTFPRGSLVKYLTRERDREQLAILSGCVEGPE